MTRRKEFLASYPDFHPGMLAYSSDGQELGEVQKLDEENLTIEKGQILPTDCRLPYDAVEDIRGDHLIINRSKSDVEESISSESGSSEFGGLDEAARADVEEVTVAVSTYEQESERYNTGSTSTQGKSPMPGGESFRDERPQSSREEEVEDCT